MGIVPLAAVLLCGFYGWRLNGGKSAVLGYVLFAVGGFISVMNFYLSFLRYPVYRLLKGKNAEYHWVSGIPLFGILSVVGLVCIPRYTWLSVLAFLFLILDTGGIPWFVISAWKDESLWNSKGKQD